MEAKKDLRVDE